MPISVQDFTRAANSTLFGSREIVVSGNDAAQQVKHGKLLFSSNAKTNIATMEAFREALKEQYGVFGVHAFDTVVGTRAQLHKSLRARDVREVFSKLEPLKEWRLANELERQMNINPAFLELGDEVAKAAAQIIRMGSMQHGAELRQCKTPEDVSALADKTIRAAIAQAKTEHAGVADKGVRRLHHGEAQVGSNAPMGLSRLKNTVSFARGSTSVEDRVKSGELGAGMRVNADSYSRAAIFEKLKTNGVEPGFIYHNDWSRKDTRGLMNDIHSAATKASVQQFLAQNPDVAQQAQGKSYLEQGLIIGRAHPAGIVFATEYVLGKELDKLTQDPQADSPLLKALRQNFGAGVSKADFFPADGTDPTPTQLENLQKVKKDCFVQLRDAVMEYGRNEADPNAKLPVFKHFTTRHILKLDYNEGDRADKTRAASTGKLRLPDRVSIKGGAIKGHFYHKYRVTTADKASIGAVSEALANDLTRMLGVPAQELTLVRGSYSNGHPKIMLEAKFADGYKDLEDGFISDGRTVGNVEPLGKYKAIFLALADRDAVGSHGQNKGVINGRFFAIDPGHSLEGNGPDLEIHDNLSFKDTSTALLEKRFLNYSVFDDDTRFAKFEGVLKLRELRDSGAIGRLFQDYRTAFDPQADGISTAEKNIRSEIQKNIDKMQAEFEGQIAKILTVCDEQLALFDALGSQPATQPLQEGAIETIENLEKLTSPTTWKSDNGKVELRHLAVKEDTRIPWRAQMQGDNLVYTSAKPISQAAKNRLLQLSYAAPGETSVTFDAQGRATISVPVGKAQHLFTAFAEENVIQATHPEEAQQRAAALAG